MIDVNGKPVNPFRLQVLVELVRVISRVTPANGCVNDLTNAVFRGRTLFGEDDPVPMVSILDQPVPTEISEGLLDNTVQAGSYPVIVQGFVTDDRANPSDPAHVLMAEVKQQLALEKQRNARAYNFLSMGGLVTDIQIGLGTVRPPETGISNKAFFWMIVTLKIAEDMADPYAWVSQYQGAK